MGSDIAVRHFYIDSINGSDNNSGLSSDLAWKTTQKINELQSSLQIQPGDSFLFKAGCSFNDAIVLHNVKGTKSHPIKIGKYDEQETVNLRPTLICSEKSAHSIRLIDCEHICIENLNIKRGGIYATFGKLSYDLNTTSIPTEEITGLRFLNLRLTDLQTVNKQTGAIEIELLGNNFILNDVEIDNCEFNNISCHAVLLGVGQQMVDLTIAKQHPSYKNVIIKNIKTKTTASSAVVLNNVSLGHLQFNELEASGQFLDNINSAGASGIELIFCQNIIVNNNKIRFSSGPKRSTAIIVGPNSNNIQITSNFSANNVGGLITCMGNCFDIDVSSNVSINDGLREKIQTAATRSGNSVVISDYVGWCRMSNKNIKLPTSRITIHNNLFTITPTHLRSSTIVIYGEATDVNVENNLFVTNSSKINTVFVNNIIKTNINIQNNLSNAKWKPLNFPNENNRINLNELNDTSLIIDENTELFNWNCIDLFFKKNKLHEQPSNNSIKNTFIRFNLNQEVPTKIAQNDNLYVFLCCTHVQNYLNMIQASFYTTGVHYINKELSKLYNTRQNILETFNDPFLVLNSEKAKTTLNNEKITSASSAQSPIELLWWLIKNSKTNTNDDQVLFIGQESLQSSCSLGFLCQTILEHAKKHFNVHFILLLNNSLNEVTQRLYKIMLRADTQEHNVNTLTAHYTNTVFRNIVDGLNFIKANLPESNFSIAELSWLDTLTDVQKFWKLQTAVAKSPLIRSIFNKLSNRPAINRIIEVDVKPNCCFFNFLTSKNYASLTEKEKQFELEKMLEIQQKYNFNKNEDHILLKFNENSIIHHRSFLESLENLGCNICCKTAFLDNGYAHTTKRIRMDYFELPLTKDDSI
jgi:hypothetical protein